MSAIDPQLLYRRTEIRNECIFRFVCIESVACGQGIEIQLRCEGSAMALAQDFSFGPVPARALLHARPRSEMPREACALRPILELLWLHWVLRYQSTAHRFKTGV